MIQPRAPVPKPLPRRLSLFAVAACAALTGCDSFPEVDRVAPPLAPAPPPALLPLDALLAQAQVAPRATAETAETLTARAARLRAEAAAQR